MYECPNCAANLKFDIGRQMLYCEHCETVLDPYSFQKEKDAEESAEYEVTVFTCPQCGGEIISEDTTAATFCSFCGSSTILDSRISKEKKPGYIIPFSKTMEDCKQSYLKMLNRAVFAPKELKDTKHIEKFRGIYMPYWVYSFENKGPVTFPGSTTKRRGDYLYTDHYLLQSELDAEYHGIAFDASSSFSDSLSGAIAPFDIKKGKPFHPSFLSGFYADTNDVDDGLYREEAVNMVVNDSCRQMAAKKGMSRYHINGSDHSRSLRAALRPKTIGAELAMFPVWFLSYRKGERIAYAVINGQTGRAAADLPVATGKYLTGSLLLALPLFVLLNMFFTLKPAASLIISALLALLCTIVSNIQLTRIIQKDSSTDDMGLRAVRETNAVRDNSRLVQAGKSNKSSSVLKYLLIPISLLIISLLVPVFLLAGFLFGSFLDIDTDIIMRLITLIIVLFTVMPLVIFFIAKKTRKKKPPLPKGSRKKKLPVLAKPICAIVLAILIWIINPVFDLYYYGGSVICMCMACWAVLDIIKQHNVLTTRKLPQLNRRGGDELA